MVLATFVEFPHGAARALAVRGVQVIRFDEV